jgi:hypothetical protein
MTNYRANFVLSQGNITEILCLAPTRARGNTCIKSSKLHLTTGFRRCTMRNVMAIAAIILSFLLSPNLFADSEMAASQTATIDTFPHDASARSQHALNPKDILVAYFDCKTGKKVADANQVSRMTKAAQIRLAASGFCELHQYTNGTYYCQTGTCTGSCSLNNIPVSCSCN